MNNHDILKDVLREKELLDKLAQRDQKIGELNELLEQADNPKTLALLMYRLIQEKERTNKLLGEINGKYDNIMFRLKTGSQEAPEVAEIGEKQETYEVLPEQDQLILKNITERGECTALDIKTMLNYKGLNAACQRLNKLYKEGYLKKVKAGRKVLYLAKS